MQINTMGLVLRAVRVGEADQILTVLTPGNGVLSASARGSLRLKNKLFSACGLFCYSEFAITLGRKTNFIDSAAVSKVFDIYEKDDILAHVQELTPYLEEQLDKLVDKYPVVAARRGKGFMQGLVITGTTVGSIVTKALENGLLVISAGSDVLRLVPPLVITKENIDEMIEKLEKSLA